MLSNLATGSLVVALFSGACAFGVPDSLARFTRPVAYAAFAAALALYAAGYLS